MIENIKVQRDLETVDKLDALSYELRTKLAGLLLENDGDNALKLDISIKVRKNESG